MPLARVLALVDWDTARRLVPIRTVHNLRHVEAIFDNLHSAIANCLSETSRERFFRVHWRIYHGWHTGKTKTADRILFDRFTAQARPKTVRRISFTPDFGLGDNLCCASRRLPLYDTVRKNLDTNLLQQKMVDTALISDLLYLIRSRGADIYIVVSNDDDVIPGIFTAESWQANIILLHDRDNLNKHLKLDGLTQRMSFQ